MKNKIKILMIVLLLIMVSVPVLAGEWIIIREESPREVKVEVGTRKYDWNVNIIRRSPKVKMFALDWYKFNKLAAMGAKVQYMPDYLVGFNVEYDNEINDLFFSMNTTYRFPKRLLIWRFYGGGEVTLSRNEQTIVPYLLLGTEYLFFFSETKLPMLPREEPVFRSGLRIYF